MNLKDMSGKTLDVVFSARILAEQIDFEICHFFATFGPPWPWLWIGSYGNIYLQTKFRWNRKNFCGRTNGRVSVCSMTDDRQSLLS